MEELCLTIGARVHLRDGEGGTLHRLVVDPRTHQITHLIILKGLLQRHDYVIPVSHVTKATAQELFVDMTAEQLAQYPEYRMEEFRELRQTDTGELAQSHEHAVVWVPPVGMFEPNQPILPVIRRRIYHGIPLREKVLGRNCLVRTLDEVIGRVDHLWLHRENWEVTHLVARGGMFSQHFVVIPMDWITSIEPDEIYVRSSEEPLPQYTADELAVVMQAALAAGGYEEPYPLDSNLAVAEAVVEALAADSRTTGTLFDVAFEGGVLTLRGDVMDEAVHQAAEEVAHAHPEVLSVVNALEVHPVAHDENQVAESQTAMLRMMGAMEQSARHGMDSE